MKSGFVIAIVFAIAMTPCAQTAMPIFPTVNDPDLSAHLTRLANDIAARAHHSQNYQVTVLASDSVNAYAVPSGEVYVTRGLIKAVNNEAEIVFVLAQQLSLLQPNLKTAVPVQIKKPSAGHTILVGLVSGALIVLGGPLGARAGVMVIAQEVGHRSQLRYQSLQTEPASFITNADKAAVEYLHEAGYDPEAAVTLLETLRALRPKGYVQQSQLPTPPVTFVERIRLVRNRIAKLERKAKYVMDSATFKALKARFSVMPQPILPNKQTSLTSSSPQR